MASPRHVPDPHLRRRGLSRVGPVTATIAVAGTAATITVAVGLAVGRADAGGPTNSPTGRARATPAGSTPPPAATVPTAGSGTSQPGAVTSTPSEPLSSVATAKPSHHHTQSSGS